jgi:hypothetical protein
MVVGAAALTVFALLLVIAAPFLPRVDVNAVDIVAGTVIFGALGAIFSVLARMTAGSLRLRAESGKQMLRTLGGVRPVVGAVAGVGLYLFIEGEALDILKKPQGSADEYSYYGALAFLAGFSERFFQDMLVSKTTQDQTAADQEHEDEEAAPAPPAEALPALEPAEAAPSNPPSARKRRNRQGEAAGGMPSDEPTGPNRPDGPEWGVG